MAAVLVLFICLFICGYCVLMRLESMKLLWTFIIAESCRLFALLSGMNLLSVPKYGRVLAGCDQLVNAMLPLGASIGPGW